MRSNAKERAELDAEIARLKDSAETAPEIASSKKDASRSTDSPVPSSLRRKLRRKTRPLPAPFQKTSGKP
jgi:hypothetical protein